MTAHDIPGHDMTVDDPSAETGTDRVVAVVADTATAVQAHRYATLIEDLAGVPSRVILLDGPDPRPAGQGQLPPDTGAVVLIGAHDAPTSRPADAAGRSPMLTEQDIAAIAVTAALLTCLSRRGRAPRASRIVIAGADALPMLCRLLVAAGVGDITTWKKQDAVAFPLRRVAEGADAVIDLLGMWPTDEHASLGSEPAVITPDTQRDPLLALPGLLRAVIRAPEAAREIGLNVEVHLACALALVMATPSDQHLPSVPDRGLVDRVAEAATQALHAPVPHPRTSRSGRPTR